MSNTVHVPCLGCGALNRLDPEKLDHGPKCGKCGQGLLPPKPFSLSGAGFDRQVLKSDLPVLVDFWSPQCGPCRMMAPAFDQAAAQLNPAVRLAKVDTTAEPHLAARYGIRAVPTLVLFDRGREKARMSGAMAADGLVGWTRRNLA